MDQKTNTLRAKISSKFTSRTHLPNSNTKKDFPKSNPITINKAPPPPPLLAKSKKEINTISKYFHSRKTSFSNTAKPPSDQTGKSYA